MELLVVHRHTKEVDDSYSSGPFVTENLILTHYMLSKWWLHILYRLGHYVIHPLVVAQILVMTNNITHLCYTYSKCRLKNPPGILYKITHTGQIITWIPSRLAWTLALQGRD